MPKLLSHCDRSPCPLARALDIVGDRWTLVIVRDLLLRDRHEYKELLQSFEGISTNILADRLRRLTRAGLLSSVAHPDSRTRKLYFLTPAGKALIYTMLELVKWSVAHLDGAQLPPQFASALAGDPDALVREVLAKSERWEAEHLPASPG